MQDFSGSQEHEDTFSLLEQDELGVLTSTRRVLELGEHVWLHTEGIEQLSHQWVHELATGQAILTPPPWDTTYHFDDNTERTVNWLLLLDALNFCFWAEKGHMRWRISYDKKELNGYWAEAASLKRALEENIPLWDANYLSTISEDTIAHIFRPIEGSEAIPLLEQRVVNAREVGRVLQEHFGGQFTAAIQQTNNSAVALVQLLTRHFSSFNDIAYYRGQEVRFFKRAQICVADIASACRGKAWGTFSDIEKLTIFADYKLPQILRHYSIIAYDPALAMRIDNQELLEQGSDEEVEIRAAAVWACEFLRRALRHHGYQVSATDIDAKLWAISQNTVGMRSYHRVYTQFY